MCFLLFANKKMKNFSCAVSTGGVYIIKIRRSVDCRFRLYTTHSWFVFFPWLGGVFLSSRVTGACPMTTDLIMRVNASLENTTTTTADC